MGGKMRKTICMAIATTFFFICQVSAALSAESSQDLFFSHYIEGSSYNKALEIFNGTQIAIDLSGYEINAYHNGSTEPTYAINLAGILPADSVFVICNPNASQDILDIADATDSGINFNGDDAIVLNRINSGVVDAIGQIGLDPGSQWGSAEASTRDSSLIRKPSVCSGDPEATDFFDPALEWTGSAQDDFTGLGMHAIDCEPLSAENVFIHDVQGNGAATPLDGRQVTIEGIVVGDFQESHQLSGFFVQEEDGDTDNDPETSEGIFVFNTSFAVNMGDKVQLTGTAGEYYNNTQITNLTDLAITSSDNPLPSKATLNLPFTDQAFLERYEGMRAVFPQSLTVNDTYNLGRYGELVLSKGRLWTPTNVVPPGDAAIALQAENDLNRIVLDDGSTRQNPDPVAYPAPELSANNPVRSGDTVQHLTGVIYFSYGAYRVHPIATPEFVSSNPRPDTPAPVGGSLKVASFNVLNYFTTIDDAACPYEAGCRGADSPDELERQRTKIVQAMLAIDADIFGLMEMENHPSDAALENLVDGLNNALGANTYAYVPTGAIGTDAIKVALVYKTKTVTLTGDYAILDSTVDPRFVDTKNRPSLAQTFKENATGETVTVVVNHLKSKGSDCDDLGDPDIGDGQGNCNQTRTAAAQALVDWLASDPTASNDPDVLIIGDMNAYAKEDPIAVFTDNNYTNLIDIFTGPDTYSYIFYGQAGYLDHALGNKTLTAQVTGAAEWRINCDEPRVLDYNTEYKSGTQLIDLYADTAFRASDHDPVIIGLELTSEQTSTQCAALGDNRFLDMLDIDLFYFNGAKGDKLTLTLSPNADGDFRGERAVLMLVDAIKGQHLNRTKTGALPSRIKTTLPANGLYIVTVYELTTVKAKKRFQGDYCLSLTSDAGLILEAASWPE
jgi:predicted extracellular nuclease